MMMMKLMMLVLQLMGFALLPLGALVALTLAFAGRRQLTRALCARCRAPLTFLDVVGETPCPGCGVPIAEAGPPLPTRSGFRIRLFLLGVACVAASAAAIMSAHTFQRTRAATIAAQGPASQISTSALVSLIAAGGGSGWEFSELRRRAANGEDVAPLAKTAVEAQLGSAGVPLQTSAFGVLQLAEFVVEAMPAAPPSARDQGLLDQVLVGCFPPPLIDVQHLAGARPALVPVQSGMHPALPELVRVAVIQRVTVNGAPVPVHASPLRTAADETPLVFSPHTRAYLVDPLPRGECIIVVELETRLYRRFDVERLRDERHQWRPLAIWAEPLARHTHVTSSTVTIGSDGSVAIPPSPASPP